ncbi:hypothetical protein IWX83_002435 [Flavobacterium sp. CG_9.1]|nr:hypothetical protein [Flavobacterium sp. CG_9.1]
MLTNTLKVLFKKLKIKIESYKTKVRFGKSKKELLIPMAIFVRIY